MLLTYKYCFHNSKTAQDIKVKFFKLNLTLMGVILHKITILINLRCCHGNLLLCMCCGIKKWGNLHICQDIGFILLYLGAEGYFWILSPKSTIKFLYDVIFTSKWREGKIPVYRLQKMFITSLWRHLLSNFLENINLFSSYDGVSSHQIWFNLDPGKQSYGGRAESALPPGWECIKSPRWDRVNTAPVDSF